VLGSCLAVALGHGVCVAGGCKHSGRSAIGLRALSRQGRVSCSHGSVLHGTMGELGRLGVWEGECQAGMCSCSIFLMARGAAAVGVS
jgi:hypothetical protein